MKCGTIQLHAIRRCTIFYVKVRNGRGRLAIIRIHKQTGRYEFFINSKRLVRSRETWTWEVSIEGIPDEERTSNCESTPTFRADIGHVVEFPSTTIPACVSVSFYVCFFLCVSVCLCVCVCLSVSLPLSTDLCVCLFVSVCWSVCLCMSVSVYVCLLDRLSVCLSVCICLWVYLSICVYVCVCLCVSIYVYVCVYVCLKSEISY